MKMFHKFLLLVLFGFGLRGQTVPGSYPYPVPFPASGTPPIGSQVITGPVTRSAYNDSGPAVWDAWVGGGYRSVSSTTERDTIRASWRKQGMMVFTVADGKSWRLDANLTSWTEIVSGGGGSAGFYHGDAFDYTVSTNNEYRIRTTSANSLNICIPDYATTNIYPNGTTVFVRFGIGADMVNTNLIGIKRSPTLALGDSGPFQPIYTTDGFVPEGGVFRLQRTYQLIYRTYQTPAGWYVTDSVGDLVRDNNAYIRKFDGSPMVGVGSVYALGDWTSAHKVSGYAPVETTVEFPGRPDALEFQIVPLINQINGLLTKSGNWGSGIAINHIKLGEGRTVFMTEILTPSEIASDDSYVIRCGFGNAVYNTLTRGVFFRHDSTSANWLAVARLSSTESASQDTGIPATASTVFNLRIEIPHGSPAAYFFINDVLVKTVSTQMVSGFSNLVHGQVIIFKTANDGLDSTIRIARALVYIRPDNR